MLKSPNTPKFPTNSCDRIGRLDSQVSKQFRVEEKPLSACWERGTMSSHLSSLSRDTRLLNKSLEPVIGNGAIRGDQEPPTFCAAFGGAPRGQINLFPVSSQLNCCIIRITYPSGWSGAEALGALGPKLVLRQVSSYLALISRTALMDPSASREKDDVALLFRLSMICR